MATRTVTTSTSNLSNNIVITAGYLLSNILVGSRIRGSDIMVLNQLMALLAGHTHTWVDLYGQHIGGNYDTEGYGGGKDTSRTVDPAISGAGTAPNTMPNTQIYATHVNFGIDLHNQVINHSHVTVDQES